MTSQVIQIARPLTGRICPLRAQRVKMISTHVSHEIGNLKTITLTLSNSNYSWSMNNWVGLRDKGIFLLYLNLIFNYNFAIMHVLFKRGLTNKYDWEVLNIYPIYVVCLACVVSLLNDSFNEACCIDKYCRVPYQCCMYGRSSSDWTWQPVTR